MFEKYTMSDFENLDETRTSNELTSTIKKLKDLKKELEKEILERWGMKFKSNIGGLYPYRDKLIDGIWIAFTQRKGREYIPYPQLNISISEEKFNIFFILYGYKSQKLLTDTNRTISKSFYDNFVTNVRKSKINVKDSKLKFEHGNFYESFSFEPSDITKKQKSELINLIFLHWDKLRPLYDMAMSDSYNIVYIEPTIIESPLSEVKPIFIELSPSEISKSGSKRNNRNKSKKIDYVEEIEKNRHTGEKGEALVLRKEKEYLEEIEKIDLIDKIKHISIEDDYAGYDILSFDENGNEKYIEVKSTTSTLPKVHRFNISSNEYEKAKDLENYYIYFVFEINTKNPKIFKLKRPFDLSDKVIEVTPSNYDVKIGLKERIKDKR